MSLFLHTLCAGSFFQKIWIEYTRNIIAKLVFAVKRLRQFHENIIKSPCKRPFPLLQGQCVDFILRFQISNRYPDQHTAQQDTVPHLFFLCFRSQRCTIPGTVHPWQPNCLSRKRCLPWALPHTVSHTLYPESAGD